MRKLPRHAAAFLLLALAWAGTAAAQTPAQVGQWGPVLDWDMQGKHMVVLPTGKVLVWATGDNARVWDPATGAFTLTPATFGDIHCGAQATLADGRVIALGGVEVTPHIGIKVNALFDPFSLTWTQGAPMSYARWYGTSTTLADGRVLVTSGDDELTNRVTLPEIYDPVTDSWTVLSGADRNQILYPFMYVLPNGKVYEAGTKTSTALLDLAGGGSWSSGPGNAFGSSGYAECGAMYAPGKILRVGGGDPSWANAAVIDMNAASPAWRQIAPMAFPRRRHNIVILATGELIAVGGTRRADEESEAILAAEIWSPATEQWRTVASMTEARMYHSASVLLPDGRVLTAGGEATGRKHAQIFSPPYLFQGARPTISASPEAAAYGSVFNVSTPDAASIASVALIRANAVTHGIDMNQRYVPLAFTAGSNALAVTAPPNGNHAPPGYYLLVIKNATGVPSVAAWLRVDSAANLSPATLSGRVTNEGTGAGIANATVSYSGGSALTNATGNYTLANVSPGEHVVSASAAGYATESQSAPFTAGASLTMNFALAAPGGVVGRLSDLDTGLAIPGATVTSGGHSVLTDADGLYAFTGLAAGTIEIAAAATGFYSAAQDVVIRAGEISPADFALRPLEPKILGEVLDVQTAQPIAGATVSYANGVTATDSLGRYEFGHVVPGTYAVTASASGYGDVTQTAVVTARAWTTQDFSLTPANEGLFTFPAVADAYVQSGGPTKNYGTQTSLRLRAPTPEYRSYLKFSVAGISGAIDSAKVRLYVTDASPTAGTLSYVGSTWSETGLTWDNAPAPGGPFVATGGAATLDSWVEFDVTPVVTANGTYSFALATTSTNSAYFSSREGANPPVLVVQGGGGSTVELPNITDFAPRSGPEGTEVTITGANFREVTGVAFNGYVTSQFTVDSETRIRAIVHDGASSGPISVMNTAGMAVSPFAFTVGAAVPQTFYFAPAADAHVNSGSPSKNYGGVATLRARDDVTDYRSFLKFAVGGLGGPVRSAKLRLFVTDASPNGGVLHGVSNDYLGTTTAWTEGGIKWSNAPALDAAPTAAAGSVAIGTWVELDVTPLVTGNGTVSFGIASPHTNSVYYSSKEGTNPPVLVVQTD
jgi:hypothetical protein